jgi:hypothetical protein
MMVKWCKKLCAFFDCVSDGTVDVAQGLRIISASMPYHLMSQHPSSYVQILALEIGIR